MYSVHTCIHIPVNCEIRSALWRALKKEKSGKRPRVNEIFVLLALSSGYTIFKRVNHTHHKNLLPACCFAYPWKSMPPEKK